MAASELAMLFYMAAEGCGISSAATSPLKADCSPTGTETPAAATTFCY